MESPQAFHFVACHCLPGGEDQCRLRCISDFDCGGYSYETATKMCHLKDDTTLSSAATAQTDWWTGANVGGWNAAACHCSQKKTCSDGDVRLAEESQLGEGQEMYFEIFYQGHWHPVCGVSFWDNDYGAVAVCRALGYVSGTVNQKRDQFDRDAMPIGVCRPNEPLRQCTGGNNHFGTLGGVNNECKAHEGVGVSVVCEGVRYGVRETRTTCGEFHMQDDSTQEALGVLFSEMRHSVMPTSLAEQRMQKERTSLAEQRGQKAATGTRRGGRFLKKKGTRRGGRSHVLGGRGRPRVSSSRKKKSPKKKRNRASGTGRRKQGATAMLIRSARGKARGARKLRAGKRRRNFRLAKKVKLQKGVSKKLKLRKSSRKPRKRKVSKKRKSALRKSARVKKASSFVQTSARPTKARPPSARPTRRQTRQITRRKTPRRIRRKTRTTFPSEHAPRRAPTVRRRVPERARTTSRSYGKTSRS